MIRPRLLTGLVALSPLFAAGPAPAGSESSVGVGTGTGAPASTAPAAPPVRPAPSQARGEALARSLGCGGCHAGLPASDLPARAPAVGEGAAPLAAEFVVTYLADPVSRRPEIAPARMPDFGLGADERLALALFLAGDAEGSGGPGVAAARARFPEVHPEDGRLLFEGLGCGACHVHPGVPTVGGSGVGPDLGGAGLLYRRDWLEAFLADPVPVRPAGHRPGTGSRMPDFRLQPDEAASLTAYLVGLRAGPDPAGLARARGGGGVPSATPSPWALHRAERYLTERLSCLGCHGWRGEGGRIAPALDGVAGRLTPEAVAAAVHAPAEARPGTVMPPSPFPPGIRDQVVALLLADTVGWAGGEPAELPWPERRAILRAWSAAAGPVATGSPVPGGGASPGPAGGDAGTQAGGVSPNGARLYGRTCAACHGAGGDGRGFNQPNLPVSPTVHADPVAMALRPDDTLYDGIASGGWVLDGSPRMPAFGDGLEPDEIRALVAHIRTLCACEGPAWAAAGGEG
ncbi:MAG TPA: cytochrome c [Longimicrobiales bacterium]|nr:cytochrome c [Longimicrobiales bacterium]